MYPHLRPLKQSKLCSVLSAVLLVRFRAGMDEINFSLQKKLMESLYYLHRGSVRVQDRAQEPVCAYSKISLPNFTATLDFIGTN